MYITFYKSNDMSPISRFFYHSPLAKKYDESIIPFLFSSFFLSLSMALGMQRIMDHVVTVDVIAVSILDSAHHDTNSNVIKNSTRHDTKRRETRYHDGTDKDLIRARLERVAQLVSDLTLEFL